MADEKEQTLAHEMEPALDPHAQMVGNTPVDYSSSHRPSLSESSSDPEKLDVDDEKPSAARAASQSHSLHRLATLTTQHSAATTVESQAPADPPRPWYHYLNPLKWGRPPPLPTEPSVCPEYRASFINRLFFVWMGPIMTTGYRRPLQPADIWTVNPDRSMDALADRLLAAFDRRIERGARHPLLGAMHETVRAEFWVGGACAMLSSLLQVLAPFTLRFLIAFAQDAYAAAAAGAPAPPIGNGLGLVFGIAAMQVLQSLGTGHFIYRGFMVGAQLRAVLICAIFEKAMRVSARARAGGVVDDEKVQAERERLAKAKKGLLAKLFDRKPGGPGAEAEDGQGWSNGRIVNLMSTDTYRVYEASGMFHMLWTSPTAALFTLAVLLVNLTYAALAGFALLVLGMPLLTKAIKKLLRRRRAISAITDERVSLTQEVLQAVRFVKLFGWEQSFLERLARIRRREIGAIQVVLALRNAILAVSMSLPVFASMLSFITYALSNHVLDPAPVFSSLALFNALRMPLNLLPMVIGQVTDAWVSVGRIEAFLRAEEQEEDATWDFEAKEAVRMEGAGFTWERVAGTEAKAGKNEKGAPAGQAKGADSKKKWWQSARSTKPQVSPDPTDKGTAEEKSLDQQQPFQLCDIDLAVGREELLAVIGTVGAGKSSLLAALAGDMRRTAGAVTLGASRAFCPQSAWIQNATLRDNILFGRDLDAEWYERVVEACALKPDLDMLPAGDLTEIGERGITLSGGQKQRLNVARAIYYDADLVLLDDPLSAVDAHVGRHIFDNAICGLLKGKCRILATHQLHVLARCDRIVWMDGGLVKTVDTFDNLMAHDAGFRTMMASTAQEEKQEAAEAPVDGGERDEEKKDASRQKKAKRGAALMQAEERAVRSVPWAVYAAYVRGSGTLLNAPLAVLLLVLSQCANIATSLWLSYWTADTFGFATGQYIGVYAALGAAQALLMFTYSLSVALFGTAASRSMLHAAMARVLRAPMRFFDTTPLGRITNRFSKDVDVMDNTLTDALRMFSFTMAMISSVVILIAVFFPYFLVAVGPLLLAFVAAAGYYRASAREVKRLEANARSHVFARFAEGVSGVASVRAYGLERRFAAELRRVVDAMDAAYYLTFANQRWLSVRLDAVAALLVLVTGLLVVTSRFTVSPAISGLVLSYILSIVQMMQFSVRQLAEVENAMNSTERVWHYGTALEQEPPARVAPGPPPDWPATGAIAFDNVHLRYRPGLPRVLRGLDLRIRGGERVALVGRTGAGKSSVLGALFRLVDPCAGAIRIDGLDTSRLGLQDLRDAMAIIPQDPTLFRGTVRSNLDPFGRHADAELWTALRRAGLVDDATPATGPDSPSDAASGATAADEKALVRAAAAAGERNRVYLDAPVDEEGRNFSLGQRQLLALARALARDRRILLCDEATSSVDAATDARVQRALATAFKGRTVICIAHRLRTVLGYDRVCVLDQGALVEVGSPRELWRRGGAFWGMCERSGIGEGDFGAAA